MQYEYSFRVKDNVLFLPQANAIDDGAVQCFLPPVNSFVLTGREKWGVVITMFKYNPSVGKADLQAKGYTHLKDVMSDEFKVHLKTFYERCLRETETENKDWKIYGKKKQFVYDFSSDENAKLFRAGMAQLTEIPEDNFTISERHLKVYDKEAERWPAPDKDRNASQFSIGLPIHLPEGSSVCVFPELDPGENENDKAVFLTKNDRSDIADIYKNEKAEMLNESVGDLVAFYGSSIFHERVNSPETAILYIKVNGDGRDPLGENIYSDAQ